MRSDLHGQNISLKRIPHFVPFCLQTRRFLCRINKLLKKQNSKYRRDMSLEVAKPS